MKLKISYLLLLTLIIAEIYGWYQYHVFAAVPSTRLAVGSYYPEMQQSSCWQNYRHERIERPYERLPETKECLNVQVQ